MIGFAPVKAGRSSAFVGFGALVALASLAALPVAGCKSCDNGSTTEVVDSGHENPTSLTPEQAKQVLVKLGDDTITLGDYAAALEHMDQFDRLRYQSVERRKELLDEMITVQLLAKEAKEKGYDKDPIAQQEMRAILRDAMLAEARKNAPTPADVPEADVRAWFEAHRAEYKDPERRRVSVIVARDEATANAALTAAKKNPAPAQWGELVRAKSIDPQARANVPVDLAGDVGIVAPPGDPRGENTRVPDEVRAAAFEIPELGGIADKVVASHGKYYVVRLTQKIAPHERTYQEAERSIRVKLAQDKLRAKEDELIAELRKSVKVEIDESALGSVKIDMGDGGGPASSGSVAVPADAGR
ncbi:MAG: Peptidyl-prolyl cis-trans isomerase PpiD [Labilithrix sp.]|nr:Peptidyl-prolyl cis-trans isomerase PpiD [Labilithrix sp.]